MPKYYGTALYGRGNYSAATGVMLAAAQGALVQTGKDMSPAWQSRLPAAVGTHGATGQGAALSWSAVIADAGIYRLAGDIGFAKSSIWNDAVGGAGEWTPQNPADNSWSPAMPGPQNWSEQ